MRRLLILIFIFISVASAHAKTFDYLSSKIDVDMANRFYKKGDYEKSIELYEKALSKNTNSYKIYNNLALAKYANGDKQESSELFDTAKKIVVTNEKKGRADLYYNSGIINAANGNYKAAISDLVESLTIDPKDDRAREGLEYSRKRLKEKENKNDTGKDNKDSNSGNNDNKNNSDNNNSDVGKDKNNEDKKENLDSDDKQSLRDDEIEQLLNSLRNLRKEDNYKNENLGNGYNSEKDW